MSNLKTISFIVPELSENLHFNKLSDKEYILSNVTYKHYLKINNDVYNLLKLIDGKKDMSIITNEYNELSISKLKVEEIYNLLYKKIVIYGILKGYDQKVKEYQKPTYLKLSFIIISEKNLEKVIKKLYFLFNRTVATLILVFSFFLILSLLYNNFDSFKSFKLQESLVYFFITMALSVTFHEIGHATSASYFGAKHGGIGGGFYLFTPVYFADVTDVWRLSPMKRVVVNLSGIYFEIIFCSIVSIIAFFTSNYTLLMISLIVCIKTLFNLNPFLRSDGYWILSDITNNPNLMSNSLLKVKQIFKPNKNWNKFDYFVLVYGIISYTFVSIFIYFVVIKNPNSILYFPQNIANFVKNLFTENAQFSLAELGKLFIPVLFFYLIFGLVKSFIPLLKQKIEKI